MSARAEPLPSEPGAPRSRTADLVALFRAAEARRAPDRRIAFDPLAEPFLDALGSPLAPRRALGRLADGLGRLPPTRLAQTICLRHRLIDDHVLAAHARPGGPRQVVILGAGLDARAYRLGGAAAWSDALARFVGAAAFPLADARFFEVDHPAFTAAKRRAVDATLGGAPGVAYAAVDLSATPLAPALDAVGFDPTEPACFVWEGVTYYLSEAACEATLGAVRALAAPGSTLVCDVWRTGGGAAHALRRLATRLGMQAIGEPFRFGFGPRGPSPEAWVERLGFRRARLTTPEALARRLGARAIYGPWLPGLALLEAEVGA